MFSLYRMDLHHRYDTDGNVGKFKVFGAFLLLDSVDQLFGGSVALYIASLIEIGQQITLSRIEITAIAWGVNVASGLLNTIGTKAIGRMSSFNMWWTVGGTFVLVITLLVKAPEKVRLL